MGSRCKLPTEHGLQRSLFDTLTAPTVRVRAAVTRESSTERPQAHPRRAWIKHKKSSTSVGVFLRLSRVRSAHNHVIARRWAAQPRQATRLSVALEATRTMVPCSDTRTALPGQRCVLSRSEAILARGTTCSHAGRICPNSCRTYRVDRSKLCAG